MNSQWMTTLFSKGLELEQSLRKNLEQAQTQLKKELQSRGLRWSAVDLAAAMEELSPVGSRTALSYALDLLKPFVAGMGLRVSRLSDTQVEMVVPNRVRNMSEGEQLHEGAFIAAGVEAARLLWTRHAPLGHFDLQTQNLSLQLFRPAEREIRVRLELPESVREAALSKLRQEREADSDLQLRFVDEAEQTLAEMQLSLKLRHIPALESPEE